jgi:hypothetical protein
MKKKRVFTVFPALNPAKNGVGEAVKWGWFLAKPFSLQTPGEEYKEN